MPSITHRTDVKWSHTQETTGTTWAIIKNDSNKPIYIYSVTGRFAVGKGSFSNQYAYGKGNAFNVYVNFASAIGDNVTTWSNSKSTTITNVVTSADRNPNVPSSGHVYYNKTKNYTFTFSSAVKIPAYTSYYVRVNGMVANSNVLVQDYGATLGMSWNYGVATPSKPVISADPSVVITGNNTTISYSADTAYISGTEYVQYKIGSNGTTQNAKTSGGQTAGTFSLTIKPGKLSYWDVYVRKYIDSSHYSAWSNYARVYTYGDPSTPSFSSSSTIVKTGASVTFNYGADSNYRGSLVEKVQYKIGTNGTVTDIVTKKGQTAGTFKLTVNPGDGSSQTIYCRKYLNTAGYTSGWSSGVTIKTYTKPSAPVVNITPSTTINGNQSWNLSWDTWVGKWNESAKYDISIVNSSGTEIYKAATDSAGTTKTVAPDIPKLIGDYDNKDIKIKIVRKHTAVSDYTASTLKTVRVIIRPTSPISANRLGLITNNSTVTPTYTYSGDGVCNGFIIKFKDQSTDEIVSNVYATASNGKLTYNLPKDKFIPTHTYTLIITPAYSDSYYSDTATTTVVDYLTYGMETVTPPSILAPTGGGLWYGYDYKVLIKMPTDDNVSYMSDYIKAAYRYKDLEITINGNTYKDSTNPELFSRDVTDLNHECYVIMNVPNTISFNGENSLTARVEYDSGWGNSITRTYRIDENYPSFTFKKGEYIMGNVHDNLYDVVHNMYRFAVSKEDKSIFNAKGTKILAENYANLLNVLKSIYDYYNIFATEYVELDPEQVEELNTQLDYIASVMGSAESYDIQDPLSNGEAVINAFKMMYSIIGIEFPESDSGFNFYNPATIIANEFIGIIIKALGLAAFVYEMALRMLGIPTDYLYEKMREIEEYCEVTYVGEDEKEYTYQTYPITDSILELLGEKVVYQFTDEEINQILAAFDIIEPIVGIPTPTEETTFDNESEKVDSYKITRIEDISFGGIDNG